MPCRLDKDGNKVDKAYAFTLLLYQDSVNEDYAEILQSLNLKCAISPWQNEDINEETGEILKPHKHCCIFFESQTRVGHVDEIVEKINAYSWYEKIKKPRDIINYLTHDSYKGSNKVKYDKADIEWINCDEKDFYKRYFAEIIDYINNNDIFTYHRLIDELVKNREYELLEYASKNTFYINCYLSGKHK